MYIDKIKFKRSRQAGYIPTVTDIGEEGELFINLADQKVYTINDSGEVISVGGGASGSNSFLRADREWTNVVGQTSFSIPYYLGNEEVTYNGIELSKIEYDALDGKHIVLKTPVAKADDVIRVKSYMGGDVVTDTFAGQPVGTISQFLKGKIPAGQLVCDGSNYSKVDYPSLFTYLGSETLPNLLDTQVGDIMPWISDSDIPDGWHNLGAQSDEVNSANEGSFRVYHYSEYPEFCDFINESKGSPLGQDCQLSLMRAGETLRQVIKAIKPSWTPRDITNPWDYQSDAIRPITGSFACYSYAGNTSSGVFSDRVSNPSGVRSASSGDTRPYIVNTFDVSKEHPVAKDVRMANRSVNYLIKVKPTATLSKTVFCIKAAGKLNDEGILAVTALKTKVAELELAMAPKHNFLINGDFSICQRFENNTGNTNSGFSADRWNLSSSTPITWNMYPPGSVSALGAPYIRSGFFAIKANPSATYLYLQQNIEDGILKLRNETGKVTFSWLLSSTTSSAAEVEKFTIQTIVGDGSAVSQTVNPSVIQRKGTNALECAAVFDVSMFNTKSPHVAFRIGLPVGFDGWVAEAKVEHGSVATPFVADDPATTLTKCQRYCYTAKSPKYGMFYTSDFSKSFVTYELPTTMRVAPNCSGDIVLASASTGTDFNSYATENSCQVYLTPANPASSAGAVKNFIANAEI